MRRSNLWRGDHANGGGRRSWELCKGLHGVNSLKLRFFLYNNVSPWVMSRRLWTDRVDGGDIEALGLIPLQNLEHRI